MNQIQAVHLEMLAYESVDGNALTEHLPYTVLWETYGTLLRLAEDD